MKKLLFILMAALLLAACGNDEPEKEAPEVEETPKSEEQKPEREVKKDEPKVDLSESKVSFTDFTIEIEKTELNDGKLILKTRYHNDSYPDEKSFMASASLDVKQGEDLLEEISGVKDDPNSNYFYKNKTGINAPVEFEYDLVNDTADVVVTIVPTDWDQESKDITVSFNE